MINRQLPSHKVLDKEQQDITQELRDNLALSCYVLLLRLQSIVESMQASNNESMRLT